MPRRRDQGRSRCRILETDARLSINILPDAVYSSFACIQLTLKTAKEADFPANRPFFESNENEQITDTDHVQSVVDSYQDGVRHSR